MNYSIDTLLSDLNSEFEGVTFSFEEISYSGKLPCFFIEIENNKKLREIWMKASDMIAINFQSRLKNEFSIWNIYLFFMVKETVESELKYSIENDTFSSRKIVIEGSVDPKSIVGKFVINSDVEIGPDLEKVEEFKPNPILFNQINGIEVKTRVTNAIKDAHSSIVKSIKEDNGEV